MDKANVEELALLGTITVHLIITLLILTYLSVGLRIWARYRVTKSPGWDDAAMIATLMLFTVYCALILAMTFRAKSIKPWTPTSIRTTLIVRDCAATHVAVSSVPYANQRLVCPTFRSLLSSHNNFSESLSRSVLLASLDQKMAKACLPHRSHNWSGLWLFLLLHCALPMRRP